MIAHHDSPSITITLLSVSAANCEIGLINYLAFSRSIASICRDILQVHMYICQKLLQVYLSGTILQVFVSIYSSIVFTLSVSATNCEIGLIDFLKWFLPSSLCEYVNIVIVQTQVV